MRYGQTLKKRFNAFCPYHTSLRHKVTRTMVQIMPITLFLLLSAVLDWAWCALRSRISERRAGHVIEFKLYGRPHHYNLSWGNDKRPTKEACYKDWRPLTRVAIRLGRGTTARAYNSRKNRAANLISAHRGLYGRSKYRKYGLQSSVGQPGHGPGPRP